MTAFSQTETGCRRVQKWTLLFPEVDLVGGTLTFRHLLLGILGKIEWCPASAALGKHSQGYGAELIGATVPEGARYDPHPSGTRRRVNTFVQIRCLRGET